MSTFLKVITRPKELLTTEQIVTCCKKIVKIVTCSKKFRRNRSFQKISQSLQRGWNSLAIYAQKSFDEVRSGKI